MHRAEILQEKKYARFKIGKIAGAAGKSLEMADVTPEGDPVEPLDAPCVSYTCMRVCLDAWMRLCVPAAAYLCI